MSITAHTSASPVPTEYFFVSPAEGESVHASPPFWPLLCNVHSPNPSAGSFPRVAAHEIRITDYAFNRRRRPKKGCFPAFRSVRSSEVAVLDATTSARGGSSSSRAAAASGGPRGLVAVKLQRKAGAQLGLGIAGELGVRVTKFVHTRWTQ